MFRNLGGVQPLEKWAEFVGACGDGHPANIIALRRLVGAFA